MFKDNKHYVGFQTENLTIGYTKREGGHSPYPEKALNMALYIGDEDKNVHRNQNIIANATGFKREQWISPIQTHGNTVLEVGNPHSGTNIEELGQSLNDVDALYTYDDNVLLTMNYADCIPVYVYSTTSDFIGLAHAGWRGTSGNITRGLIDSYTGDVQDLRVLIGPGINMEAYEVDAKVIKTLENSGLTSECFKETATGFLLNLKMINKNQALEAGIHGDNIFVTELGTEDTSQFFSFRVEGGTTGRAMAFIGRNNFDN